MLQKSLISLNGSRGTKKQVQKKKIKRRFELVHQTPGLLQIPPTNMSADGAQEHWTDSTYVE